ncbi:MAG: hypothetical protein ACI8Q2_000406, partial [Candidatus Omnitrophota bacterium]
AWVNKGEIIKQRKRKVEPTVLPVKK